MLVKAHISGAVGFVLTKQGRLVKVSSQLLYQELNDTHACHSYYKTWLNTTRICSASLRFNSTSLLFTLQYMVELHLEYPVNPSVSFHRTL